MKKITLYINGKFYSQNLTGVQRYARNIVIQLDQIIYEEKYFDFIEIIIIAGKDAKDIPQFKKIKLFKTNLKGSFIWEQILLSFYTFRNPLLNLTGSAPFLKKNQFITIHDAAIFDTPNAYKKNFIIWYKFLYYKISETANLVFTVSKFSKSRLINYLPKLKDKLYITYNGHEHFKDLSINENILKEFNLIKKNYFVIFYSPNPNKNIRKLINLIKDNFYNKDIEFILIGDIFSKPFLGYPISDLPTNIKFLERLDNSTVKTLLKNAISLIVPSTYEGFGLPLVEAMKCDCPILCSDIPAFREICKNSAVYFDPVNNEDIFKSIKKMIELKGQTNKLQSYAKRLDLFKWKESAKLILLNITKYLLTYKK